MKNIEFFTPLTKRLEAIFLGFSGLCFCHCELEKAKEYGRAFIGKRYRQELQIQKRLRPYTVAACIINYIYFRYL